MKSKLLRLAVHFPGNAVLSVLALLALRMILHRSVHFGFLVWNIFLAILPLCFARAAVRSESRFKGGVFLLCWLLLFPNAAYLVTDIVHLHLLPGQRFWLDLILLFATGALGIALSLRSLHEAERYMGRFLAPRWRPVLTIAMLLASGYGIYLGRVERWNSWDPFVRPLALLRDVFNDFRHPFRNRDAWLLTGLFAAMQLGAYMLSGSRRSWLRK